MKTYKERAMMFHELKQVVCNVCGEVIERNEFGYVAPHLNVEVEWGYGSSFDGEKHSIDMCEECYKKWISAFKIPLNREAQ